MQMTVMSGGSKNIKIGLEEGVLVKLSSYSHLFNQLTVNLQLCNHKNSLGACGFGL